MRGQTLESWDEDIGKRRKEEEKGKGEEVREEEEKDCMGRKEENIGR